MEERTIKVLEDEVNNVVEVKDMESEVVSSIEEG
jgi:hypothetical protein